MPKTGRNDPCPCGSGKKAKKCCGAPGAAPSSLLRARRPRMPDPRTLDSEQIRQQLGKWGISAEPDEFRAAVERHYAGQDVAQMWLDSLPLESRRIADPDFVMGSAIELWRRECADRPSTEMLMGWIQEGHDLEQAREPAKACETWERVWHTVLDRLPPSVRTTREADRALGWDDFLGNLVSDLQFVFLDLAPGDIDHAKRGVHFCRETLDRFANESPRFRAGARATLGELLGYAGRIDEAERELEALISESPHEVQGYCNLAALHQRSDPRRALVILERAVSAPVHDGEDYDLEHRISDLRRSLAKSGDASGNDLPDSSTSDAAQAP